jgi:hypothetical protein
MSPGNMVAQLYPRAQGSLFCRFLRLAGLRWRYSDPPPHGPKMQGVAAPLIGTDVRRLLARRIAEGVAAEVRRKESRLGSAELSEALEVT